MSIYDLPSDSSPPAGREKPSEPPLRTPEAAPAESAGPPTTADPPGKSGHKTVKKRRFGCGSCLLGCFGMLAIFFVATTCVGWFVWKQWPTWARDAAVAAIEESDLPDAEKQEVITQIDRIRDAYQSGEIDLEQVVGIAEQMTNSPLPALMMADAAIELYVKPSGLSDEEKQQAELTLTRVARGFFDEQIDEDELSGPLDYISDRDFNDQRTPKESVSDEDLRAMLAQCKELADAAGVAKSAVRVDVGDEFTRVVDKALADNS